MTRKEWILTQLVAWNGNWCPTAHLSGVDGGSEGMRRLRELRREILDGKHPKYKDIEKRRKEGSTQWEYRLVRARPGELFA